MKVIIRPLKEEDAYTSVIWRNDPEVFKFTGNTYSQVITIDSELEWIRKVIANNKAGLEYRCAIEVDGEYVGNIYLTDLSTRTGHYHIFIGNRNFWGRGVAKKASELIIRYGFEQLHLDGIRLKVKKTNTRAVRLYKSLGFVLKTEDDLWYMMLLKR